MSFACFSKEVTDMTEGECGVLALDARRHGERCSCMLRARSNILITITGKTKSTSTAPDTDLSIEVLTTDLFALIQKLYPDPSVAPTFIVRTYASFHIIATS